jgi:hypothetical protein
MDSLLCPQSSVVVASGTRAKVQHWADLLRRARIRFEMRHFSDDHLPTRSTHAELWADQDKVDKARSIIRSADDADESLLW